MATTLAAWLLWQRRHAPRFAPYLDQPLQWFARHLIWLPLLAVTFIGFIYGVRHAVYAALGGTYLHESWPFVIGYESLKLLLFEGLWLGIIFGFDSFEDVERADRMLARRGDLLRVSLQINDREMTTLREEMRTLELFAQIMQERFSDRVTIAWNIQMPGGSPSAGISLL